MEFESTRLAHDHVIDGFDCGKPSLNDWLKESARRAVDAGMARVYVWTQRGERTVRAYFAICPTEVVRTEDGLTRKMSGGFTRIPGYLIARLALDGSLHGSGYGEQLLLDAIGRVVAASEIGAGRLIVVDALDEDARAFYLRYDFEPVKNRERRLVMTVATASKALGTAGPTEQHPTHTAPTPPHPHR